VEVISKLLANAIQFTQAGGYVGVRLERVGAHARIQVIDHGKGIPHETLPSVFDGIDLHQNPVSPGEDLEGGLAMARAVVTAHGGRIRAESTGEGEGSTFTVELPLSTEAPVEPPRVLAGVRVLLVDDDDDMCFAVRTVLELYGAEVTAVASAAAALAALELSKPHVLLSDISMPTEDGYDLMRKVAERDATLPAAALTASVSTETRARALAAGFRMHLAKPFDAVALVMAVASLTGRTLAKGFGALVTQ
jgi:CheY-like chemotaxis protein